MGCVVLEIGKGGMMEVRVVDLVCECFLEGGSGTWDGF